MNWLKRSRKSKPSVNTFSAPCSGMVIHTDNWFTSKARFDDNDRLHISNSNIHGKSREYMLKALALIVEERMRQDKKFPPTEDPNIKDKQMLAVLTEEVGEIANAILEKDYDNIDTEIIQVAAVCVKWWAIRRLAEDKRNSLTSMQKLAIKILKWIKRVFKVDDCD